MQKTFIILVIAVSFLITACSSVPKPKIVDGSKREPVNKTIIKSQTGGSNGK